MKKINIEAMTVDELWTLHSHLRTVLEHKILAEKRNLEKRLLVLSKLEVSEGSHDRKPYPPVVPKFQNPDDPSETWSGRGRTPLWLATEIAAGHDREEFLIKKDETAPA